MTSVNAFRVKEYFTTDHMHIAPVKLSKTIFRWICSLQTAHSSSPSWLQTIAWRPCRNVLTSHTATVLMNCSCGCFRSGAALTGHYWHQWRVQKSKHVLVQRLGSFRAHHVNSVTVIVCDLFWCHWLVHMLHLKKYVRNADSESEWGWRDSSQRRPQVTV